MNILNRLKQLESRIIKEDSEFCQCCGIAPKREVQTITIDEWKRRIDAGEETLTKLPDVCDQCGKTVDKRFIETTFEQARETVRLRRAQAMETLSKFED